MKRHILLTFLSLLSMSSFAQYTVRGGVGIPYKETPANKMDVYLLNGMQGAQISYTSSDTEAHQWYKYSIKANEAEPIDCVQSGSTSSITNVQDGFGYFVGSNLSSTTSYVWIIDYSKYLPVFHSIYINEGDNKCEKLTINASVDAEDLYYYTPTGIYSILPREYTLSYYTMELDVESCIFETVLEVNDKIKNPSEIRIDSPFRDTDFTLSGDKYARHFGIEKTMSTPVFQAVALLTHAVEKRDKEKVPNEFESETSGPIYATYQAYANEPVAAMYIWKIFFKPTESSAMQSIARYTDRTISFNFDREGDYFVQLEVIDRTGVCNDTIQEFTVKIGESEIRIPQAFSPGSSPGVNDEFRVSYTSIVDFKCTIFNRWGTKLYEWNDPAKGWDGRVNGRLVPTGAYVYIIQYKGTKNSKTKVKKGTVNILRGKY